MSTRAKLVLAACAVVSLLCFLGAVAIANDLFGASLPAKGREGAKKSTENKKSDSSSYYCDFRGSPIPMEFSNFLGPNVTKLQAEGLRITFSPPNPYANTGYLQLQTKEIKKFNQLEDCEVTATIELFTIAPAPNALPGDASMGVYLMFSWGEAKIGRVVRPDGAQEIEAVLTTRVDQKPKRQIATAPCSENVLRLQLRRTSDILHFLWAPGTTGDNFEEVYKCIYDRAIGDPILRFESPTTPPGKEAALDVRLIDFRISHPNAVPLMPSRIVKMAPKTPLSAMLLAGFGLVAALGGMWYFVKQRSITAKMSAETTAEGSQPEKPEPASEFVVFACSVCGRTLQSGAELAGKKAKCPQCQNVMVVPQP